MRTTQLLPTIQDSSDVESELPARLNLRHIYRYDFPSRFDLSKSPASLEEAHFSVFVVKNQKIPSR
jgi:hypothetical protein